MKKFENVEVLSYNIYIKVEKPHMAAEFRWLEGQPVTLEVTGSSPVVVAMAFRWTSYKNIGSN